MRTGAAAGDRTAGIRFVELVRTLCIYFRVAEIMYLSVSKSD
jgi:hypothetical protein